jgi:IrrE N-terminal-like domain
MKNFGHARGGFVVSPRKKRDIYDYAAQVRSVFSPIMGGRPWVPLDRVIELLPSFLPGFVCEICEPHEMGGDHGQTDPDKQVIRIREDVYEQMCHGQGRDRFTVAHELGHLMLHQGQRAIVYSRSGGASTAPIYQNSEWQADTFASAFLIDEVHLSTCQSVEDVQAAFGVSRPAAEARFRK